MTDHHRSCLLLLVNAFLSTCTCLAYVSKSLLTGHLSLYHDVTHFLIYAFTINNHSMHLLFCATILLIAVACGSSNTAGGQNFSSQLCGLPPFNPPLRLFSIACVTFIASETFCLSLPSMCVYHKYSWSCNTVCIPLYQKGTCFKEMYCLKKTIISSTDKCSDEL